MSNWTIGNGGVYETLGADTTDGGGTQITTGGANSKGSWTSVGTTGFQWDGFIVKLQGLGVKRYLIDLSVGSPSDQVLIENFYLDSFRASDDHGGIFINCPIKVPDNTLIRARGQANTTTVNFDVILYGYSGSWGMRPSFSAVRNLAADTSNSRGVQVDPGAAANTKGSWTTVVASTAERIYALKLQPTTFDQAIGADFATLWDIAIGASTSEVPIIENLQFNADSVNDFFVPNMTPWLPVDIPAGSRISVRFQSQNTTASDREALIGLYALV